MIATQVDSVHEQLVVSYIVSEGFDECHFPFIPQCLSPERV